MEQLQPPIPRRRFDYWGNHANLLLPEGVSPVTLEYLTEPPHGDPLFKMSVDRITVGGWETPVPFFGRDIHLSDCCRFLAITSLLNGESWFHVVDLRARRYWSRRGFVLIEALSSACISYRPYPVDRARAQPSDMETLRLDRAIWVDVMYRPGD